MIKLYKIILTLTVLTVVVSNILVNAQGIFPTTTSTTLKQPPPPPKTPDPPPKTTPPFPPPPPPPPKTTETTTTPLLPPPPLTTEPPPPLPKTTDTTPPQITPKQPPPPITTETLIFTPTPSLTSAPVTPSQNTQLCTTSKDCDNTMFCNQGKCQLRGLLGYKCVNKDGCLNELICNNKGFCQYKNNGPIKSHSYDVKKAAITGGIIVGIFIASGFIFVVYRGFKKREERKGRELTSSIYSTDGTAEFDPIYPFSERSNSFSGSKPTSPSHVPTTNHYDPLPPAGSGGFVGGPGPRQGYYNYYNNDYNGGGYMRQNENEVTKRTINLLQQTRGNVMIAPHAPPHIPHAQHAQHPPLPSHPPHLQQNYNWNYGVPGTQPAPSAQQQLMMNQDGLFPVPSIKRNGGLIPNNMNKDIKKNLNNKNNKNNFPSSSNSSYSTEENTSKRKLSPNVNSSDKQKKTQNLRDLNSVGSTTSNTSESSIYNVESIYDTYARESMFKPKTLEAKLSQEDLSKNNTTINQNTSKPIGRSRSRTFGHADGSKPLQSIKSSTVEEQKNVSRGLNGINENDEI
ncbi:hypothetical protein RclHR1_05270001 [Rhizophagus clarus]|uniref:Uncharacterized protein n=1 Tax=Rhizophagus clarus TaxID=94130 RepID=A0A2Z6S4S6_9GLOM|nr:hypothetical protein RclHR1_05270001 [Rhizophagus clarus]GES79466.1 hypothetical protein GLOIN_2v1820650 [Rhizophagus clarus]